MRPEIFPFFFVTAWVFAVVVVARTSGWSKLAAKYATDKSFPENTKGWQSALFAISSYKSCVWIGCDHAGVYMKTGPLFLFRLGHSPLFIPWSAFSSAQPIKRFWMHYIKFEVRDPQISFSLTNAAFKDNMQYLYDNKLTAPASD